MRPGRMITFLFLLSEDLSMTESFFGRQLSLSSTCVTLARMTPR
jgi:hypothetical protein